MGLKNEESFQKKCRLCGRLGRRFTDIFTPQLSSSVTKSNKKLSQLIFRCLQLQVSICMYACACIIVPSGEGCMSINDPRTHHVTFKPVSSIEPNLTSQNPYQIMLIGSKAAAGE
jgi:hypothetical protein